MAAYGASWKRGSRLQCPAPRLEISLRLGEVGNGVAWQRVCPVGFAGSCSQQIDYPIPYPQGITKARERGDGSSSQRCYLVANGSVLASGWLKLSGHEAGRRTDTPDQPLNKNASVEATQEPSPKLPDHGVQCSNAWAEPCSGPVTTLGVTLRVGRPHCLSVIWSAHRRQPGSMDVDASVSLSHLGKFSSDGEWLQDTTPR